MFLWPDYFDVARLIAVCRRVYEVQQAGLRAELGNFGEVKADELRGVRTDIEGGQEAGPSSSSSDGGSLVMNVRDVSVVIPTGLCVSAKLNFTLRAGESLLIMGPSGCGKTATLRVMAGLWPFMAGRIDMLTRIGRMGLYFLPQTPYLNEGNLRSLILYPTVVSDRPDAGVDRKIIACLEQSQLDLHDRWPEGLNTKMKWADVLSPGEQQLLSFARVWYHRPALVMLDEASSALDPEREAAMYTAMRASGIAYVFSLLSVFIFRLFSLCLPHITICSGTLAPCSRDSF